MRIFLLIIVLLQKNSIESDEIMVWRVDCKIGVSHVQSFWEWQLVVVFCLYLSFPFTQTVKYV